VATKGGAGEAGGEAREALPDQHEAELGDAGGKPLGRDNIDQDRDDQVETVEQGGWRLVRVGFHDVR
jgi:hypothetical protein